MSYDIGDRRKLTCQIRDEAGDPADPDELIFQMRKPSDGTVITYAYGTDEELVREETGSFSVLWDCTESGTHHYRWLASGDLAVAEESRFRVRPTTFTEP